MICLVVLAACNSDKPSPYALKPADPPATATEKAIAPAPIPQDEASGSDAPAKVEAVAETTGFKVGDTVSGRWTNGKWYPGKIAKVNTDGTFDVAYNDGDYSKALPASKVKARKVTAGGGGGGGGGRSSAASSNAPCPGPGLTRRCGGRCVNIQQDDNNCGGCGNRCSGGKHCDGHMSCRDADGNL